MSLRSYVHTLTDNIRQDRKAFTVYSVMRVLVIAVLVRSALQGRWESVAICALTLVLLLVPTFVEKTFRLDIPTAFEVIIYVFIFAAEILGEVDHFYVHIPGWDTMLHTINGFLAAAVGFSMLVLLNKKSRKIELSPAYLAMVAFCFSMTVGVCWEFIEFGSDYFLGQDMQKDYVVTSFSSVTLDPAQDQNVIAVRDITRTIIETASGETFTIEGGYLDIGIRDTMKDLIVNFIGAVTFSVIGYGLVKNHGKPTSRASELAAGLILQRSDTNAEEDEDDMVDDMS